jgi:hypothetical protein
MAGSSVALLIAGVACLFAPIETLSAVGIPNPNEVTGQLLGTVYVAFAAANWTARGSMIGGIYARPLSVANFLHFVVGGVVLAKGLSGSTLNVGYLSVTLGYLALAICFILVLNGRLLRHETPESDQ